MKTIDSFIFFYIRNETINQKLALVSFQINISFCKWNSSKFWLNYSSIMFEKYKTKENKSAEN